MAVVYTYSKYKDVHSLQNDGVLPMTYTITKVGCDTTEDIKTGVIQPNDTVPLTFIVDGEYSILLDDGDTTATIPSIKVYNRLLMSFVDVVEGLLCGCAACDECKECNTCEDYLQAIMKAFSYAGLHYPLYQPFINSLIVNTQCDLASLVTCSLLQERVYGKGESKKVLLKIIRDYYTSFYYKDIALAADAEEEAYIKVKYKAAKILKCIRQLGTNPSEILEGTETDARVYYWQLDNITDGLDEVTTAITGMSYLNTKPNSPFIDFEAGKIVNYTNVGRIVFAIAPTLVQDFIIRDSLNNDITDEFDTAYNADFSAAIFVSKSYYGLSNIYFKFKKDF